METITYSLKMNQKNSNQYYENVRVFTDEVLREFENYENSVISNFISYLQENSIDKIRSYNEYIFEFLMLGIFWRAYSLRAYRLDENPQKLLENFAYERQRNQPAKETVDLIRGMLMTLFLVLKDQDNGYLHELDLNSINKLLGYLKATGDFSQEVKRLEIWNRFLEIKTSEEVSKYLLNAISFAEWFECESKINLGKYTSNIDEFLKEKSHEHLFKEDLIFCSRKEVECHMNMVGAEIMNRAFKNEFNERPRKALLLPCQNHWNNEEIPTNINVDYLMKLFNIKSEEYCELKPIPAYY